MKLCRHDTIARFIAEHEGRSCSARTVRRYIAQKDHPMPVRRSGAVDVIDSDVLERWLDERAARNGRNRSAR